MSYRNTFRAIAEQVGPDLGPGETRLARTNHPVATYQVERLTPNMRVLVRNIGSGTQASFDVPYTR